MDPKSKQISVVVIVTIAELITYRWKLLPTNMLIKYSNVILRAVRLLIRKDILFISAQILIERSLPGETLLSFALGLFYAYFIFDICINTHRQADFE